MKISMLNILAQNTVGDGGKPNLYFVTDNGNTVLVTIDRQIAYDYWQSLASRYPRRECALEDRLNGCVCSVEPYDGQPNAQLCVIDDYEAFLA